MSEYKVDARGQACPTPVILTRQAILESGADVIRVSVDDTVARDNVQRMATSQGWKAKVEDRGSAFDIVLSRGSGDRDAALEREALTCGLEPAKPNVVVLVASDQMGQGAEELGRVLMRAFVKTLKELDPTPQTLIFLNSGVHITSEGSELLNDLKALVASGLEVLSCGTCLDYYGLKDKLAVGRVSNMYEIASALVRADRVVRP